MFVPAHLSEEQLERIKEFEESHGAKVLAFENESPQAAPLSNEDLNELKDLEQETGLCLVAVK
jgi:hypothetical protein